MGLLFYTSFAFANDGFKGAYDRIKTVPDGFKTIIQSAYKEKNFKKVHELLQNKSLDPTILIDEKNNLYVIHFLAAIGALETFQFMLEDNATRFVKSLELKTKSGHTAHEIARILMGESRFFKSSLTMYRIFGLPDFIQAIFSPKVWREINDDLSETYRFLDQTFEQVGKKENLWREFETILVSNIFEYTY
jgi:hypothetical protein